MNYNDSEIHSLTSFLCVILGTAWERFKDADTWNRDVLWNHDETDNLEYPNFLGLLCQ